MKFLTFLWIGVYLLGSLNCGVGAKINCCAREQSKAPVRSCHSSSQPSDQSPVGSSSFDLCCCSISAAIPKGIEDLKLGQANFSSFLSSSMYGVLSSTFKTVFSSSSLSPPGEFYKRHFFQLVFPSHAPPLSA